MKSTELKNRNIRHAEYYGMLEKQDILYSKSREGQKFSNLMQLIQSDENILLAYRNIKRNKGSTTSGTDGLTIKDIEKLPQKTFLLIVKKRFSQYLPRKVKRVEIPKPNGTTRPLGIPSIWDRISQQCILQILEPICEAKFYQHSYGFRPNRSAENAIASCMKRMNIEHMHYVVDIDIKSFFDEVNHVKLIRQLWTMGIQDRQLLVIIRKMLKAPIVLKDGTTILPTKGTPQGGVLSPLLANIYLNEFDWWIANQWEQRDCKEIKSQWSKNGTKHRGNDYRKLRKSTTLKEMHIVRYADDFKIFTHTRNEAEKIFLASKMWLYERLRLSISEEKSKITNLRKEASEFLGFTLRMVKKSNKIVCRSNVTPKALKRIVAQLKEQIKKIQKQPNSEQTIRAIKRYNSQIIGIHNYYRIATAIAVDFKPIQYQMLLTVYNRLKNYGLSTSTSYKTKDKGIQLYLKSRCIRYLKGYPIIPVGYVQTRNALHKRATVNRYSPEGRLLIHKKQRLVPNWKLEWLRTHYVSDKRASVEFNDNRLSLFVAQGGKCAITHEELNLYNMHCHHKIPYHISEDDSYTNLILIGNNVHTLIHATKIETTQKYLEKMHFNEEQFNKLNILRELAGNQPLSNP